MKIKHLILVLAITGLTACQAAGSSSVNNSTPKIFAITGVTIIDVKNGNSLPGQTVILEGERIEQVGPTGSVVIPEGAIQIDGQGLYLMPGLVDAHVHYYDAPIFGRLLVANGVVLVRDTGNPNDYILPLRDQLNRGEVIGPEMVATGTMLDGDPVVIPQTATGITTPEGARMEVRAQAEAGVDLIKTYSRLDREVFLAILDEANQLGLKVMTHLPETMSLLEAAEAGLASSEHFNGFEKIIGELLGAPVEYTFRGQAWQAGYFMQLNEVDPAALQAVYEKLRQSGITICPTVVTFKTMTNIQPLFSGDFEGSQYVSEDLFGMWKSLWAGQSDLPDFLWQNWVRMVAGLNAAGVPLMVGTDLMLPGIMPGYSVHEEMAIWQEAGIPPADILRSATLVPVEFMGKGDRLGSVEPGKTASLILVRGNPLEDVRNAAEIESVFLRGQYYDREGLDQLLEEAEEQAKHPAAP